jgi:sigma-B regulation protein RsbU (phosphoserine phosphatase)
MVGLQQNLLGTQRALLASQERLIDELRQAAAYIESRLPVRLRGPVASDWCFLSSSQLGGDFFDHQWLSESKLACYLLDVCGHGVGACLLSASIQDALRSRTLPDCDFERPAQVVAALNRAFQMQEHGERFFTIWYGVYDTSTRRIEYSCGGHHAALFFEPGAQAPKQLMCDGMAAGVADDSEYESASCAVPAGSRLYLFSDGAFEVEISGGGQLGIDGLIEVLLSVQPMADNRVDRARQAIESRRVTSAFQDDFSLLELQFE